VGGGVPMVKAFWREDGVRPDERVMIAHNASFDRRMLEGAWTLVGSTFPSNMWVCTMEMSRKLLKKLNPDKKRPEVNLRACISQFGFKAETNDHSSSTDSRNTYRLRDFLLKNGIDELTFIKKSKTSSKLHDTQYDNDPVMNEMFDFSNEED